MDYLYVKSLHVIFVVTWFAGLFYVVRLYIYFKEAEEKSAEEKRILQDQYKLMIRRLWNIITWPSAILTLLLGSWLLMTPIGQIYLSEPWMHLKLFFVLLLYAYHISCHVLYKQTQKGSLHFSSDKLRLWNEIPTLILFACVFLVVLKNTFGWIFGVCGILGISVLLMVGIKFYKKHRRCRKS
jgi:putative membrane protein